MILIPISVSITATPIVIQNPVFKHPIFISNGIPSIIDLEKSTGIRLHVFRGMLLLSWSNDNKEYKESIICTAAMFKIPKRARYLKITLLVPLTKYSIKPLNKL